MPRRPAACVLVADFSAHIPSAFYASSSNRSGPPRDTVGSGISPARTCASRPGGSQTSSSVLIPPSINCCRKKDGLWPVVSASSRSLRSMAGSMRTATTFNFSAFLGLTNLRSAIFNVRAFYAELPDVMNLHVRISAKHLTSYLHACVHRARNASCSPARVTRSPDGVARVHSPPARRQNHHQSPMRSLRCPARQLTFIFRCANLASDQEPVAVLRMNLGDIQRAESTNGRARGAGGGGPGLGTPTVRPQLIHRCLEEPLLPHASDKRQRDRSRRPFRVRTLL